MNRRIKIRQLDKQDCGAACLASVASYYGLKIPVTVIRKKCGTSSEGTNIKGILDAASELSMEARAYKSSTPCYCFTHLSGIPVPSILHIRKEDGWLHYVVLYNISRKYIEIMDPSDGQIHKMDEDEFRNAWTGYIIIITPKADFKKGDHTIPLYRRISSVIKLHKNDILPSLAGSAVYVLSGLGVSLYLQHTIDHVIPMGSEGELFKFTALTAVLILLSTFVGYIRTVFLVRGSVKIDGALIMEYTHHILHLPTSFFQEREVGDINSRIGDIYRIRSFISGNLIMVSIATVSLVVSFVLLFSFYWKLAVVILGFIPLYITLFILANHKNKEHNKKIIEASASFESSTIGAITSIETARFFSAQEHFYKRIEDRYVNLAIRMFKGGKSNALIISSIDFLNQITPFLAVTLGSLFVLRSELSIGELVSFYTITSFFTSPLSILIESTRQLNEARIAAQRVFEVMDMEIEEFEQINIPMPSDPAQCIRFDNVSFHYPGKRDLFNNLTFEAPNGKITSIAGKNGCGKSTVAALLMRAHEPASGSILSGNLNISQFSISEWRKHISIIPQRESLFDGTALENIVLGDNNPDIDKVLELCEAVGMIDFIKNQPKGLATPVGEGGKFLSAGERTKIALIRALYRSPQIIIMDEVTSHLDTSSSQMIIALARRLADEGKTIINITHDRKFLEISDYVVNL